MKAKKPPAKKPSTKTKRTTMSTGAAAAAMIPLALATVLPPVLDRASRPTTPVTTGAPADRV